MNPPAKKQKKDAKEVLTAPIIFKLPGLAPDVRLTVFGREFHVHSTILKQHSAYFRKFLDSSEKTQFSASAGTKFKYEYISAVDKDGEWGLQPVSMTDPLAMTNTIRDKPVEKELRAFEKLVSSMYNLSFEIDCAEELGDMTRLADFYLALPVLSSSLYRVLWASKGLMKDMFSHGTQAARTVLRLAKKLRQPILFRDALTITVGKLGPDYNSKNDPFKDDEDLSKIVLQAHHRLCQLKLNADYLTGHGRVYDGDANIWQSIMDLGKFNERPDDHMSGADFYRKILETLRYFNDYEVTDAAISALEALVEKNLGLTNEYYRKHCGGATGWMFLCTSIEDEDLPWDPNETNWPRESRN